VGEAEVVRRNRELQRRFYGEPLGDRLRRLLAGFGIPQVVLAETLGISPTMLSQLMSGRRVKIGTPAVLGRLVMLERSLGTSGGGDPAARTRTLEEVRLAQPLVGADPLPPVPVPAARPAPDAYAVLRTAAAPEELARAADTLARAFPSLAGVLRRAAEPDRS
jgi:transcriptional regulator with XRE-family HTH domain